MKFIVPDFLLPYLEEGIHALVSRAEIVIMR